MSGAEGSLVGRALRGFGWIFAWRMATRLLGMASTVVLVRLLTPADFGLLALSSTFLQAIDSLSALGVEDAVVRAHAPQRDVYDTAFTMILLRSAAMALVMAAGALPLAAFFDEPRLAPVVWVTAAITLLGGWENVRVLEFRRDIRFDREFALQLFPRLAGVAAALTTAVLLEDYWALVAGSAMLRLVRLPMSYVMRPYRPRLTLSAWRGLLGFSFWTWLICMLRLARDRTSMFVLGHVMGIAPAGLFNVALDIGQMPQTELILPMGRAMYSAFGAARRSGGDEEAIWLRMVGLITLVVVPIGVGMALVSAPTVRLLLGAQWMPAAPLLCLIVIASALALFDECCHVQFDSAGLVKLDFRTMCVTCGLRVLAGLALVPPFGLAGAAWGLLLSTVLEQLVYLVTKYRVLPFSPRGLLQQIWRPALGAGAMAAVVAGSGLAVLPDGATAATAAAHLFAPAALGAATYMAVVLLAWLAAGRPAGPEASMLERFAARVRRLRGVVPTS